jgi:hypothetical protein
MGAATALSLTRGLKKRIKIEKKQIKKIKLYFFLRWLNMGPP